MYVCARVHQAKKNIVDAELEPGSKHDLYPSPSPAQLGNPTSSQAQAELSLDIQLTSEPGSDSNLAASQAYPAQLRVLSWRRLKPPLLWQK